MVDDALSRKSSISALQIILKSILLDLQKLEIEIVPKGETVKLSAPIVEPTLKERIVQGQIFNDFLMEKNDDIHKGKIADLHIFYDKKLEVPR